MSRSSTWFFEMCECAYEKGMEPEEYINFTRGTYKANEDITKEERISHERNTDNPTTY